MSCHTFERIVRSKFNAQEFFGVLNRMAMFANNTTMARIQPRVAERKPNEELARKLAEYLATINLSKGATWNYELKTLPRPTGRATRVVITEYDLPRRSIAPHDVRTDAQGYVWYSNFVENYLGRLDPKSGAHTEYAYAATKPGFPTGSLALEAMIRDHNPDYKGTANKAGRAGMQSGNVSELTAIAKLKPGGGDRLRRIFNLTGGNFDGAQKVSTLHDMRFVLFDDDTRILFATAYDGDWDTYINDFATKIPDLMDLLFANVEGWPGIASPDVKDFIADHQIDAAGWFVANPQVTVVDVRRLQRMETALDAFLDTMAGNTAVDPATRDALALLSRQVSVPHGVDY